MPEGLSGTQFGELREISLLNHPPMSKAPASGRSALALGTFCSVLLLLLLRTGLHPPPWLGPYLEKDHSDDSATCYEYSRYATEPHGTPSSGPLRLPYMRPSLGCRTFSSPIVEVKSGSIVRHHPPQLNLAFIVRSVSSQR